jgi:hypothetical protein
MKEVKIMTTYSKTQFASLQDYLDQINPEIQTVLDLNITCVHKLCGKGDLIAIEARERDHQPEFYLTFQFATKPTTFAYSIVSAYKVLSFDQEHSEALQNLFELYSENYKLYDVDRRAEDEARRVAEAKRKEDEKKAKADEKKAEAFERKKVKDIKDFEEMLQRSEPLSAASEFYQSLGWLAKHTGTVSAALPDYLEPSFVKHFGDVPRRVVDSKKKGPAGWTSQWNSSFAVSLKKAEAIPVLFEQYLNPARKALTDSKFVRGLIDNYGFQFGKTQNLDAIRSCIPDTYLTEFECGLAM